MITIGFFFINFGIFFFFVILLTLLGYFFQYHLFNTFKSKKISLTILLESFGVGTVLYIFYSYFIIDFYKSFNFFFNYLPLIVFVILNLFYICIFYKFKSEKNFKDLFNNIKNRLSNKLVKRRLTIVLIIFILFLVTQGVIEKNLSLPAKDPYNWFNSILYLHKYGDLDYESYTVYGTGFVIFNAGALLVVQDYYIQYFFIKYNPVFFFFIIILLIFDISSKIFKKDYEILIALVVLLCFNSLLYRFFLCVPSVLATVLGIIFINTLFEKNNLRITIIRGLFIGGIFLIHLWYFILILGFFLLFESYYLILNLINKENKKSEVLLYFLKKHGLFLAIIIILTIPYFLNLIISDKNIIEHIERYLYRRYSSDSLVHSYFKNIPSIMLTILNLTPSTTDLVKNLLYIGFDIPINKTLSWGFIFIVLGLLYVKKWDSPQKKYLIEFIKFTFVVSFLIFILDAFLFIVDNDIIFSIASFVFTKGKRVFEIFAPCWSILFVLGVKKVIKYIQKVKIKKLNSKMAGIKKQINLIKEKMAKTYLIFLMILGASLFSYHLYLHYNIIYENYFEDDDLTEAVLYIGDYLDRHDIEDENILVPKLEHSYIYDLIYNKDIDIEKFKYDDTSYSELISAIVSNKTDYVLVKKDETKSSCLEEIEDNMKVLYENDDYLFFKVD
ncbi:MAG: hypothetical protein ACFE8A_03245 [Candidatus Hodarchaeota archaeon]